MYVCICVCKAVIIAGEALKFNFHGKNLVRICTGNNCLDLSGFE
jgi:hypothetical protein